MRENSISKVVGEQVRRTLWEVRNVNACVPDTLWQKPYGGMPLWKHIYHTLHSLDQWLINPRDPDFREPDFHEPGLNSLDVESGRTLSRAELDAYSRAVVRKAEEYLDALTDGMLLGRPVGCGFSRLSLLLEQLRHLSTHMGMLMGFLVAEGVGWPTVIGLEKSIPQDGFGQFF